MPVLIGEKKIVLMGEEQLNLGGTEQSSFKIPKKIQNFQAHMAWTPTFQRGDNKRDFFPWPPPPNALLTISFHMQFLFSLPNEFLCI